MDIQCLERHMFYSGVLLVYKHQIRHIAQIRWGLGCMGMYG